jgi:hypothetical protein
VWDALAVKVRAPRQSNCIGATKEDSQEWLRYGGCGEFEFMAKTSRSLEIRRRATAIA